MFSDIVCLPKNSNCAMFSDIVCLPEKLYKDRWALYTAEEQKEQTAVYTLDMLKVMLLPG